MGVVRGAALSICTLNKVCIGTLKVLFLHTLIL